MNVVITGADGFIGSHLMTRFADDGISRLGAVRRSKGSGVGAVEVGDIGPTTDWTPALEGRSIVVHTAAIAHRPRNVEAELADIRSVNVDGVVNLANQAVQAGVRRFIYLSSIKVHGDQTQLGAPFTPSSPFRPTEPYAASKAAAERAVTTIGESSDMEVVVVRPVLVYGPGVRANFESLMRTLCKGIPLPLATVRNQRSYLSVFNLCDFVLTCARSAGRLSGEFLVSDGEDLSTPELLARLARALQTKARLFSVPTSVLRVAASSLGKRDLADRLCSSLQVDSADARKRLGWSPPMSVDEGFALTAAAYLRHVVE